MITSGALQLGQDADRFSINEVRLGQDYPAALAAAEQQFGRAAVCEAEKAGNQRNKMASLQQTCIFEELRGVTLAEQEILQAQYQFGNGKLQQVDFEIKASDETAGEKLIGAISEALGMAVEQQGPMNSWVGANDAVLLVRQGNYRLRIVNRLLLPDDADYSRITPRS
ncbi:MAG: hypothetical protein KDJ38_06630 [Gammaproteobacteria bacterium]|nr:hypothetical protein [Gammaproteobacteria bacterium]